MTEIVLIVALALLVGSIVSTFWNKRSDVQSLLEPRAPEVCNTHGLEEDYDGKCPLRWQERYPGRTGIPLKEPKIDPLRRYTANAPAARAVSELIAQYGGRPVLEAVADYCYQHLGVRCFPAGFGQAAEQLRSAGDSRLNTPARRTAPQVR